MSEPIEVEVKLESIEFSREGDAAVTFRIVPEESAEAFRVDVTVEEPNDANAAAAEGWQILKRVAQGLADKDALD